MIMILGRPRRIAFLVGCSIVAVHVAALSAPLQNSFVHGSREVMDLLAAARLANGGAASLLGARSLLVRGNKISARGAPSPFTYRLLYPDYFQDVGTALFTVHGRTYWQRPDPGEVLRASAQRRKTEEFVEVSFVYLLRAPSIVPLNARKVGNDEGTVSMEITGPNGFARDVVFDKKSARITRIVEHGILRGAGASTAAERRVSFGEYKKIGPAWFPTRQVETFGTSENQISIDVIELNSVSAREFEEESVTLR